MRLSQIYFPGIESMVAFLFIITISCTYKKHGNGSMVRNNTDKIILLPRPILKSSLSLEEALANRRSVRDFKKGSLNLAEVSQLLWAAQGITDQAEGGRTAPSAGALYPLEVYVVSGMIDSLDAGVYHYYPGDHSLEFITGGDKRKLLSAAALMQGAVQRAPAVLVFTAVYERTTVKYLERGRRYVHMEAGHAAQNVYLQAASLKLGTVVIGAFNDTLVRSILHLGRQESPLYLMPVGKL